MARRRYQRGHLRLRGKREKVWVAMWREDVIAPDGTTQRIRKSEVLGTLKEYKTRQLHNPFRNMDSSSACRQRWFEFR
jgi:hypothetical protein